MKKTILSAALALIVGFITCTTVYAGSCTAVLDGPEVVSGKSYSGKSYALASSYATATGPRAKTYFYNLYSLSNTYVALTGRTVTVKLMEEDSLFNNNDHVKTYVGKFVGRTLNSITHTETNSTGNIESEGDHISELYISTYLEKASNDPGSATRSFFDYQLCQE